MSTLGTITSFARASPKSTTLVIISLSSFSITPASLDTSTTVLSSFSVMFSFAAFMSTPNIFKIHFDMKFTRTIIGVRTTVRKLMIGAILQDNLSAFTVAMVFGVISPKMRTTKVSTPVAIPMYAPPNFETSDVVRDEAERLAILFPIRIAESILDGFAINFSTNSAFLFPS